MADASLSETDAVPRLMEFFHKRGVRTDCPMCGTRKWTLHSDARAQGAEITLAVKESYNALDLPAYALICNNCGFIRLHSKVAVESGPA